MNKIKVIFHKIGIKYYAIYTFHFMKNFDEQYSVMAVDDPPKIANRYPKQFQCQPLPNPSFS